MSSALTFRCPLPFGLHARPASQLAEVAQQYSAQITLTRTKTETTADAKSVLAIVSLDVCHNDECLILAVGKDAEDAQEALGRFVQNSLPHCDEDVTLGEHTRRPLPRMFRGLALDWISGTPASHGVGIGCVVHAQRRSWPSPDRIALGEGTESSIQTLEQLLNRVRNVLAGELSEQTGSAARGILEAHLAILGDPGFIARIESLLNNSVTLPAAIVNACDTFADALRSAQSPYVRERAIDVEDVGLRLLEHLGVVVDSPGNIALDGPSVLVADNWSPRQLLAADRSKLEGLILQHGGSTSHTIILARSFSIPTLVSVSNAVLRMTEGSQAIIDAQHGLAICDPPGEVRAYYERERNKQAIINRRRSNRAGKPARTNDGVRVEIAANIASADELIPAIERGAEGAGLFRTEMLFFGRQKAPSEETQYEIYSRVAKEARPKPVIIRTLDAGGDKPITYLNFPDEANPFLGYRGTRIYQAHLDIIDSQLRAVLRASAHGDLWIMAPMVSTLDEIEWLKNRLAMLQRQLRDKGHSINTQLKFGIMVEVPSIAYLAPEVSRLVDFVSIGTNDLLQYFIATDRGHPEIQELSSPYQPAFLRFLRHIVDAFRLAGIWVGMCGEFASDVRATPLLVGLGLNELSVSPPNIPVIKSEIPQLDSGHCRTVLEKCLNCGTVEKVQATLASESGYAATRPLLAIDTIVARSTAKHKEEAIKELVDKLELADRTRDGFHLEEAIWQREDTYSTYMGHGFAVPHCKSDAVRTNSIAVTRLASPIAWSKSDNEPVQFVIMLAMRASDEAGMHMRIFSRLARRLMHEDVRNNLISAETAEKIHEILTRELATINE